MALFAACVLIVRTSASAQQLQEVQAIVDGLRSPQHAAQADDIIRQMPGVVMSRTDWNTRNFLMHTTSEGNMDATQLNALLQPIGLSLRCFQRQPVGSVPFHHLDPRACGIPPDPTR